MIKELLMRRSESFMLKSLPYAISNFETLIKHNYAYIDKTKNILLYEESNELISLLLRPHSFGKTLFTEIIKYYYDQSLAKDADELFSDTYIAHHATPLKSQYLVLKVDFSSIAPSDLDDSFCSHFKEAIKDFYSRYPQYNYENYYKSRHDHENCQDPFKETDVVGALNIFLYNYSSLSPRNAKQLMVIIDGYDDFIGKSYDYDPNPELCYNLSREQAFIKFFYQTLKFYFQNGTIGRIFIIGTREIYLECFLYGFNYSNVSSQLAFNEMIGFTVDELSLLLDQIIDFNSCAYSKEAIMAKLQQKCRGYKFSQRANEEMFSATECIKCIDEFMKDCELLKVQ